RLISRWFLEPKIFFKIQPTISFQYQRYSVVCHSEGRTRLAYNASPTRTFGASPKYSLYRDGPIGEGANRSARSACAPRISISLRSTRPALPLTRIFHIRSA